MKRMRACLAAMMVLCLLAGVSEGQKPAAPAKTGAPLLLRYRFQKNMTFRMRVLADQLVSQSMQGQKIETNQKIGMGYRFHVLDIDPTGKATMEVVYQSILIKQSAGPMGSMEYDSTKPATKNSPIAKGYSGLVGQKFTMQLAQDGKVSGIKGIDAIYKNMLKNLDMPKGPERDQLEANLKTQFGEQSIQANMDQLLGIYPEKALSIGDFWTRHWVLSTGFPMILDSRYTLTARESGTAHLKVHSSVKSNASAAPLKMGNDSIRYNLNGVQDGTMAVDETTGWVKRSELKQNFSGSISVSGSASGTVPLTVKGTVTVSRE